MKVIIAGTIEMDPDQVEAALAAAKPLIEGALSQPGCMDYSWCADPFTPGRVHVFERWTDEAALASHFKNRWYQDMRTTLGQYGIKGSSVLKYRIDLAEPVYDESGTPRADFFSDPES